MLATMSDLQTPHSFDEMNGFYSLSPILASLSFKSPLDLPPPSPLSYDSLSPLSFPSSRSDTGSEGPMEMEEWPGLVDRLPEPPVVRVPRTIVTPHPWAFEVYKLLVDRAKPSLPAETVPRCPPRPFKEPPSKPYVFWPVQQAGGKRFKCLQSGCTMQFDKFNALKQHMLTHTGEKPFECEWCHKTFSLKCNLRRHHNTCKAKPRDRNDGSCAKLEEPSSPPRHSRGKKKNQRIHQDNDTPSQIETNPQSSLSPEKPADC